MSGFLIVVLVIAAVFAIRHLSLMVGNATEKGVMLAGTALGEALSPKGPQSGSELYGELMVSRSGTEIRQELAESGAVDPADNCLTTNSGVTVELTAIPGTNRLACSWNDTASRPTSVLGDVLRVVRQVDENAQVVLDRR